MSANALIVLGLTDFCIKLSDKDYDALYKLVSDYKLERFLTKADGENFCFNVEFKGKTLASGRGGDFLLAEFDLAALTELVRSEQLFAVEQNTDTLIMFSEKGRRSALLTGDELRNEGLYIETSLLGDDIELNKAYANRKGISGILYFADEVNIKLMDLAKNIVSDTTIFELLGVSEQ